MSEQKTYTVEDFRETAEDILKYSGQDEEVIAAMLRQAADAEEENAKLKARLEAVAKECNGVKWDEKIYVRIDTSTAAVEHNKDIDAILRLARGEGGAE